MPDEQARGPRPGPPFPAGFEPVGNPLGAGSSAVVWLARRTVDGRTTALKVWRGPLADDGQRQRFLREVRHHAELAAVSGHLVAYTWAEPDADPPWIAVEPHGGSLVQELAEHGRPPLPTGLVWAHDLLLGLAAMHSTGTLHRDVSPANVLVDRSRAKLCDFGLTLDVAASTRDNGAGTPRYLAPELQAGDRRPDPRSDVWSAAVTVRDLLGDDLPAGLEQTLTAAASFRPEDRPATAASRCRRAANSAAALGVALPP
ncbi:protein kinase, partial [Kineococcus sp. R8]|uniref:serine/threonine-protein kinase n=1 Tax=Kineococcus siccus TaxID=2696567 RepID=UPI001412A4AE